MRLKNVRKAPETATGKPEGVVSRDYCPSPRHHNHKQRHVHPTKQRELTTEMLTLQIRHECHESKDVKHKADEPVIASKG